MKIRAKTLLLSPMSDDYVNDNKINNKVNNKTDAETNKIWTENELKKKFKTLSRTGKTLGQEVKTWKEAVTLANQVKFSV